MTTTETTTSRRGRTLLTVVLPAVLVVGAIGGGLTYTGITVAGADRSAPTQVWEKPDATAADKDPAAELFSRGRATTELNKLLLPVPDGYRLGPDVDLYGNDGELDDKQAAALVKEEGKGLAGKKRREFEKRVDRAGIKGIAVRSFASADNDLVVTVHITRMKDKRRIHDMYELRNDLAELLELKKGPKIGGHKNSACFLIPAPTDVEKDEKQHQLEGMTCSAYDSEFLVSVSASGGKPFDKSAVATLVKKQLDHIKSPGEYV
ncbi:MULTISPECIES: hypothetical protein [Streptomyces]|uniref:Secreted protein n=1 Tax=Streptomyces solicathayae TaxID=3081768 RepID=A0ABZ0LVS2_9ACTN|nr:hypothetical protein [Streptomyces sp. HUAS YS2]WOX23542.1 hypothetical protein R2D22_20005 [Streptomyces sp. HUAS YS2]